MARQTYAYLGSGMIKMREFGAAAPFVAIGNCSALTFGAELNNLTLANYTKPGGGTYARVDRVTSVTVALTCHDLSAENLARASGGGVTSIPAGTVTDEALVAYKGGTTPFSIPPSSVTSVESAIGSTVYVAGTDYIVTPSGIEIPETSSIPDPVSGAANIVVTYANTIQTVVEAVINSGREYELIFEGLNEAESDLPVIVHAYRVKFAPSQSIGFIGDDFASMELTGTGLSDVTKTGTGISQYWKATIVE